MLLLQAELTRFIADALISTGAAVSSSGQPISYCRIQPDKNFAFVEVRSAEEASNTMALDGIVFKDMPLKVWLDLQQNFHQQLVHAALMRISYWTLACAMQKWLHSPVIYCEC
jgi:hypothetical protein